jgi:hypothetical protein
MTETVAPLAAETTSLPAQPAGLRRLLTPIRCFYLGLILGTGLFNLVIRVVYLCHGQSTAWCDLTNSLLVMK